MDPRKAKHVTKACQACRIAKTKCSGEDPCERCRTRDIDCDWQSVTDFRSRRMELKRKLDDLEYEASTLREIVDALRHSNEDATVGILSVIKSGATQNEIHKCVREHRVKAARFDRERSPILDEIGAKVDAVIQRQLSTTPPVTKDAPHRHKSILDIARLGDDPPIKVPAKPWTFIIDDDDLASHLVSCWSVWNEWLGGVVALDCFVRDMKAGHLESQFCSPFLVNCILATGCLYSHYHDARPRNGSLSDLQQRFMREVNRIWENLSREPPKLTTLQGLVLLFQLAGIDGNDRLSCDIILSVGQMAEDLEMSLLRTGNLDKSERELQHSLSVACWGAFNTTTATCRAFMRLQHMKVPECPFPQIEDDLSVQWSAYPKLEIKLPGHRIELCRATSESMQIDARLGRLTFSDNSHNQEGSRRNFGRKDKILNIQKDLSSWHSNLLPCLRPNDKAVPDILLMNAWYQMLLLDTVKAFNDVLSVESNEDSLISVDQEIDAAVAIGHIISIHYKSFGFDRIIPAFVAPTSLALFRLVPKLSTKTSTGDRKYVDLVTDMCVFLRAISRRVPFCVAVLRMYQVHTQQQGYVLPSATDDLFIDFEAKELLTLDPAKIESVYPTPSRLAGSSLEEDNMTEFLRRAANLSIGDSYD